MPHPARRPRFSIVSTADDDAESLHDLLASIEAQTYPLDDVEVVLVDDGSTDGTADTLALWQQRRPGLVRVLTQADGGRAAARNAALDVVTGEWVTMADPDDTLSSGYLAEVAAFIDANPAVQLVATTRIVVSDAGGDDDEHARLPHGNKVRNLERHPSSFLRSASAAFFRAEVLNRLDLRLDARIGSGFEDGHLCSSYLLQVARPLVGVVGTAEYHHRRRADRTSTVSGRLHPGRYTTVLERGYLSLLRQAQRTRGHVPGWLQNLVLYELASYFQDEESAVPVPALDGDVVDEVDRLLRAIAERLEPRYVEAFSLRRFRPLWREILLHGLEGDQWHSDVVVADRIDMRQKVIRLTYRFTGSRPDERFRCDGVDVDPLHEKVRAPLFFGRRPVRERIVWLPYSTVSVELDGRPMPLTVSEPDAPRYALEAWRPRNEHVRQYAEAEAARTGSEAAQRRMSVSDRVVRRMARTSLIRRLFGGAWVLVDRLHDADDSAEHLFRWLRERQRHVNAWFVIEKGVPHERQLRREGYRRVVPFGSLRWKLLMLNCDQLISSHADTPVFHPPALSAIATPEWRFVFLQHGVIKDDLSTWLNAKRIDVFVTSTPGEYHSIVDDDTAYDYTTRETVLTGLPRFDRLLEAAATCPPENRDLVLIAPSWRKWLVRRTSVSDQRWGFEAEAFRTSDYWTNWAAVLSSPQLGEAVRGRGLRLGLLMHPNQQPVASQLDLPDHVELLDFDSPVRRLFARSRMLVTDYSSMAFNTAYLDRPTVYFQFDRDRVFGGEHVGRKGYFDYERDGFGPVTFEPRQTVAAICEILGHGRDPAEVYLARIRAAFPERDGRCCERVYQAIQQSLETAARPSARRGSHSSQPARRAGEASGR